MSNIGSTASKSAERAHEVSLTAVESNHEPVEFENMPDGNETDPMSRMSDSDSNSIPEEDETEQISRIPGGTMYDYPTSNVIDQQPEPLSVSEPKPTSLNESVKKQSSSVSSYDDNWASQRATVVPSMSSLTVDATTERDEEIAKANNIDPAFVRLMNYLIPDNGNGEGYRETLNFLTVFSKSNSEGKYKKQLELMCLAILLKPKSIIFAGKYRRGHDLNASGSAAKKTNPIDVQLSKFLPHLKKTALNSLTNEGDSIRGNRSGKHFLPLAFQTVNFSSVYRIALMSLEFRSSNYSTAHESWHNTFGAKPTMVIEENSSYYKSLSGETKRVMNERLMRFSNNKSYWNTDNFARWFN
jgi:hypothetical protein